MSAPLETAQALAKTLLRRRKPHAMPWRWDAGIGMLGLAHVMEVCPRTRGRHLEDLHDYQLAHRRVREVSLSDQCVGAQTSLFLLRWADDTEARFAIDRVIGYLRSAPENQLGVFEHLGRRAWFRHAVRPGAWVDSMMMYVLTASQLGRALRQRWLQRLALRHAIAFCDHLQHPGGLFRHAKLLPDRRRPVLWLRGNGWAAASLVELAEHAATLASSFRRQAEALLRRQRDDGLWPTIVDAPRSAPETSGSALVAYALARGARVGLLGDDAAEAAGRAWQGLVDRLSVCKGHMTMEGISVPSIPGPEIVYRWTPHVRGLSYGIGAMLMLAAELGRGVATAGADGVSGTRARTSAGRGGAGAA